MNKATPINALRASIAAILMSSYSGIAPAQVKLTSFDWMLPTYEVAPPDRNPMFFKGESYQGASKVIYPYAMNDVITDRRTEKPWKALKLENEYIELCITPGIGGKLYYAADKTNGYNFIYRNNVVKPSNIGMLGAWVSGGIEWCVLHHHRASTFMDVDYTTSGNPDGSKTIWVGETEPRHRMRWTAGITVFPERSYFRSDIKIHNPTSLTHSFLYWANVAAHTNENYQVIFPPSVNVATYHAKNSFTNWPFSTEVYNGQDFTKGVDVSWWKNSPNSNSFFAYDLKEDFMGGYDHGRETGTVHIGDHNIVKGAKLWEWGSGPRGQATEGRLTEKDGPYVEIMTGAFSDNQPDYSWIRPYEVKMITQYWYPVKDIGGFKNANLEGVVNLEPREKDQVFLGYCLTRKVSRASIILKNGGNTVFSGEAEVSPEKSFTRIIKIGAPYKFTDLYTEIKDTETGQVLVSYQPVNIAEPDSLPEEVKRPPRPADIATVEELYLTGSRIEQFHNPTLNAMDYYMEALLRDPYDIRTNTAMGNIYLKNGDYPVARTYFSRAIRRLTKDYTRPSSCEALYLQGLTLRAMGLLDEASDTLFRATWDNAFHSAAYLELARISSAKGDYQTALARVDESLSTNTRNNSAIAMRASLLRKLGRTGEAMLLISGPASGDPLDFRLGNEIFLLSGQSVENAKTSVVLESLRLKMRDNVQNYLELAAGYLNDGFRDEAENVLKRFPGKNPLVNYYLGYISHSKGSRDEAARLFREGSALPVDYVFPFRLETIDVLKVASEYFPGDARPWYYLGNLLYDRQPARAIEAWERSVSLDPTLAVAHRNLGWGYYRHQGDGTKAIASYEKAISLNRNEPVYYEELDALYEMSNSPVAKRLALFDGNNDIVSARDDAFARQITVLTLAGKADRAVEYLEGKQFSYREGSSRVRDIMIDAHLMLGRKFMAEKNYSKALEQFLKAQVPEEEAGGSRLGNRNYQVEYFIGSAYRAMGNKSKARQWFQMSTAREAMGSSYIRYYQGLSWTALGNSREAEKVFNDLVTEGDRQISRSETREVDFFAKFGEREAENARLSNAYLLKGLGYKGLGKVSEARENLQKATELSSASLYAKAELEGL